ncbi:hypothetical protein, partial [Pseudomonas viridiflava]|uniref:hypothetical protein n=1 Tax=Pseudomonas viridiflava TaxID=33069 RepID=UPI001BAFAD6D
AGVVTNLSALRVHRTTPLMTLTDRTANRKGGKTDNGLQTGFALSASLFKKVISRLSGNGAVN